MCERKSTGHSVLPRCCVAVPLTLILSIQSDPQVTGNCVHYVHTQLSVPPQSNPKTPTAVLTLGSGCKPPRSPAGRCPNRASRCGRPRAQLPPRSAAATRFNRLRRLERQLRLVGDEVDGALLDGLAEEQLQGAVWSPSVMRNGVVFRVQEGLKF